MPHHVGVGVPGGLNMWATAVEMMLQRDNRAVMCAIDLEICFNVVDRDMLLGARWKCTSAAARPSGPKWSTVCCKGPSAAQDGKIRWQNRKMVRNTDHLHLFTLARNQAAAGGTPSKTQIAPPLLLFRPCCLGTTLPLCRSSADQIDRPPRSTTDPGRRQSNCRVLLHSSAVAWRRTTHRRA